ncbi:MAG: DUF1849 family protein [Devosia sp.]
MAPCVWTRGRIEAAWSAAVLVSVVGIGVAAMPTNAVANELRPHRAIYDVTLGSAEPSASVITASGRLVFEVTGASCEGYVVNSRFVTRVTDREGGARTTDLRSSTFEALEPANFSFLNQTYVDGALQSETKGSAEALADGTHISLTAPKESEATLTRAVFPTAHTLLILQAALAGDTVLEAPVFDGGDSADTVYDTTTVIGSAKTGLPGAKDGETAALEVLPGAAEEDVWRLVISYFAANDQAGERTPDYEIAFSMLKSGISYNVVFNYGAFSLSGTLAELTVFDVPEC